MPKLEYFLVAESISIDQDRNTVSLFHVLEDATARTPWLFPQLVAVSAWNIQPEEIGSDFQATLRIHLPGEQQEPPESTVNFTGQQTRQRIHHFVQGLNAEEVGDVVFEILMNGKHAASHTFTIRARDESD